MKVMERTRTITAVKKAEIRNSRGEGLGFRFFISLFLSLRDPKGR